MAGHVYILGAGFSVPLGGPLFKDLLTYNLHHRSKADELIRNTPFSSLAHHFMLRSFDPSPATRRKLERELLLGIELDAEQLVELVDEAANSPDSFEARTIKKLVGDTDLNKCLEALKLVIAAQSNHFVARLESGSERVEPFLRWVRSLDQKDTVISFNYDLAVEKLFEFRGWKVPDPDRNNPRQADLIKLHGSADWIKTDDNRIIRNGREGPHEDDTVMIGIPGREKANLCDNTIFDGLWNWARRQIIKAEVVSIIGYSMPETDNNARLHICDALASAENLRRVNIVLGPDAESFRSRRIQAMITPLLQTQLLEGPNGESAIKHPIVRDLPLYAQDYVANVSSYIKPGNQ
ncbi:MAG TPA: hypothetical protein DDW52_17065 [Planctomycetaceae bacterium]|nr:hypothetical protein [Planctomycetaceae bacterium]